MVGWGSAKNMVPGFSLQATMVRGDIVVGLGCKGGFGEPISMVKNPIVLSTFVTTQKGSSRVGSPQHREKGGEGV